MLKKIFLKIYSFFIYLFNGLRDGEKIIMGDKSVSHLDGTSVEQQQEQDSVWADLLKGELTQRVKDLRYETMHAERKSKEYQYIGGGIAQHKGFFDYKGNVENECGYKIIIVQENKNITGSDSDNKEYIVKFKHDFIPRFKKELYLNKIVLKGDDNGKLFLDLYFSKYRIKYDNKHKFFLSELKRVYGGDTRSELVQISEISFTSLNAYGIDNGITKTYKIRELIKVSEFDGSYVINFSVDELSSDDFIESAYDEVSAKKFANKEKRVGFIENLGDIISVEEEKKRKEEENEEVERLLKFIKNESEN